MKSNKSATNKTTPKTAHKLTATKPRKKSSERHTRAIQLARIKTPTVAPPDAQVEQLLCEVVQPATFAQVAHFQRLGLREHV